MRWGRLAIALFLLGAGPAVSGVEPPQAQVKEEKGRFKILIHDRPAGEESLRLEEFDDGRLGCFTKTTFLIDKVEHFADAAATLDAKSLRPRLYAALHRLGKSETEVKLDWKAGRIESKVRRGGQETPKDLNLSSTSLCDTDCFTHTALVVRRFKDGKHQLKVLCPAALGEMDLTLEDKGTFDLKGEGRSVRGRRWSLVLGTTAIDYLEDDRRFPILIRVPSQDLRLVLEGYEDLAAPSEKESRGDEEPLETRITFPSGRLTMAGRLFRPAKGERFPAMLLIGETGPSRTFLIDPIARAMARAGFVVLCPHPRGTGGSQGDSERATLTDLTNDSAAALSFLRTRKEVDINRIGLLGHGEGGIVALLAAARDSKPAALFLLAVPGKPLDALLLDRLDRSLRTEGTTDEARKNILEEERRRLEEIKKSDKDTMVIDEKDAFIGFMRERFNLDVPGSLAKLSETVVLFQGSADVEVAPVNADVLEKAMKKAGKENFEAIRLEGLDHLFRLKPSSSEPDRDFLKSLAERAAQYLK